MKDRKGISLEVGDNVFFSIQGETKEGCVLDGRGKVIKMTHEMLGTSEKDVAYIWVEGQAISLNPYKRSVVEKM